MEKTKTSKFKKILLIFSIFIVAVLATLFSIFIIFYNKYELDNNKLTKINNGISIYASNETEEQLYNTNRSIVDIDTLPNYVTKAFVDTEDKRFYSHNGYDLKRIVKAGFVNLVAKNKSQGASTISQQLVKNTLLTNEKTYARKFKELILSMKLEKQYEKKEILEMYLNTIYFGSNAYGLENASRYYFDKSAKDLSIDEACCLAGIIKSPNHYSPTKNYENAINRRRLVAQNMLKNKHISSQEYQQIISSPIIISNQSKLDNSYEREAILEACSLLNITERELINCEYKIVTHKDKNIQEQVMRSNKEIISQFNTDEINNDSLSVVIDNTGKVKAYFANSPYDLHNLKRQSASILKPLAVYLPCFIHNILSPASMIKDEAIDYNGYSPKNADNLEHGDVSVREALTKSLNIPAVKALDYVGLKNSKETLEALNINISDKDLNLSLALGSTTNGISLMKLLSAYSCLANNGILYPISFVDKILDKDNHIVYKHEDYATLAVEPESCFMINDILKDTKRIGTTKRLNELNLPIASKTGTATVDDNKTDLYNIAYTTEHTILTWIANIKDNKLTNNMTSSYQPTEINKRILKELYKNATPEDFLKPEKVNKYAYNLIDLENEHKFTISPDILERYIAYDYFKDSNKPALSMENKIDLSISLSQQGAILFFTPKKSNNYYLYKKHDNQVEMLAQIKDRNTIFELNDNNIFEYDNLTYYLLNENGDIISNEIKIRPKDYLITLLDSNLKLNKKKWYV